MKISRKLTIALLLLVPVFIAESSLAQRKKDKDKDKNENEVRVLPWEVDTLVTPIHISRKLFTDKIEKTIDKIDAKDGAKDGTFKYGNDITTEQFTKAFGQEVPRLIILIENLQFPQNEAVKFYKAIDDKLQSDMALSWDSLSAAHFTDDYANLRGLIIAVHQDKVADFVNKNQSIYTLNNILNLQDHYIAVNGWEDAKPALYQSLAKKHPSLIMSRLSEIKDKPYADTIISDIADIYPGLVLEKTLAGGANSQVIKRSSDPLVQTIVRIAGTTSEPERLMPFLGPIDRGEKSITDVQNIIADEHKYLQGLVDMKINKEPVCHPDIEKALYTRIREISKKINQNNGGADPYASIQNLRDIDYYMLLVEGKDLNTTETLNNGLFPLLDQSLGSKTISALIYQLQKYKFRSFIRICAENDRLEPYFKKMTEPEVLKLLSDFITNLEEGPIQRFEEGVEAATAFQYLKDEDAIMQLRSDCYLQYDRVKGLSDVQAKRKGVLSYGILNSVYAYNYEADRAKFFDSFQVSQIPFEEFKNDKGEIIELVSFYGDAIGKDNYASFINEMKANSAWKVEDKGKWVKVSTNGGSAKITIYANKITTGEEESATASELQQHLQVNNIQPVVIYNFGPISELRQSVLMITPAAKVIMSGSTFGGENLVNAYNRNPDIHILSSTVSTPARVEMKVFSELNKQLNYGRNLNWNDMWKDLTSYYTDINPADKDYFKLFVQPNKHFGSLFSKVYLKTLQQLR